MYIKVIAAAGLLAALAGCNDDPVDRALIGGGLGAGTGAIAGGLVGDPVAGGLAGAAAGAAAGALTDEDDLDLDDIF